MRIQRGKTKQQENGPCKEKKQEEGRRERREKKKEKKLLVTLNPFEVLTERA